MVHRKYLSQLPLLGEWETVGDYRRPRKVDTIIRISASAIEYIMHPSHFTSDTVTVRCMLYGFGDDEQPYAETIDLLEELVIDYIADTVSVTHSR